MLHLDLGFGESMSAVGVLVALFVSVVGWIRESIHRRRSERERVVDRKLAAYYESVSVLHDYLFDNADGTATQFWNSLFRLALVAPKSVVSSALEIRRVKQDGGADEEKLEAARQLLESMRDDLGEALPGDLGRWLEQRKGSTGTA